MIINVNMMAQTLGINVIAIYILLISFLTAIAFLYNKMKDETKKKNLLLGSGVFIVLFIIVSGGLNFNKPNSNASIQEGEKMDWQLSYQAEAIKELDSYETDIGNTDYYNYNDPLISELADSVALEADSPKDAMILTLKKVRDKVDYVWGEDDNACFGGTAPEILASGNGQCDTQSMVVIAVLRKLGIAAKPVGGCLFPEPGCRLQALFPINPPQYTELNVTEGDYVFSRASITSRKGGLHAWVTAWDPDEGWITLEATTGLIADTKCWNYHVELFPTDSNKNDICVSSNYNYAAACQNTDLQGLNAEGLGLVQEVSP